MRELLSQIHYATSANLSLLEIILLALLGTIAWNNRKGKQWLPVAYCVFLILYITLLRRASGYNESIRLRLKLQWRREGKKIVAVGFALSVFCEVLQYLTGRGMADVNDVLFNTLGTLTGVCIAKRLVKE